MSTHDGVHRGTMLHSTRELKSPTIIMKLDERHRVLIVKWKDIRDNFSASKTSGNTNSRRLVLFLVLLIVALIPAQVPALVVILRFCGCHCP
ncbi:hypothetical protein BDN71DRAFT_1446436 [Pleurotus eryngii]|uniref:Uncharacterized protein n=1 Tax=Pleurotus eryngii TaxID=5323 RepID=A0A9P6DHC6_PLEER|nr:hypothetical protein BDN71DRAFT_1446436 [Pleurotus eryngii]